MYHRNRRPLHPELLLEYQNAVCLTLYNESWSSLSRTLECIASSIYQSYQAEWPLLGRTLLCIMCDGAEQTNPELGQLLSGIEQRSKTSAISLCDSTLYVLDELTAATLSIRNDSPDRCLVVSILVKDENRGKLDSHSIFFREICALVDPEYCYQVDAGTLLPLSFFKECVRRFENDPDIAAISPKVIIEGASSTNLIEAWQSCDFCLRNEFFWPLEAASGYLSVIPGQASALRWRALLDGPPGRAPIDAYLRGAKADVALNRIKYMAEDRVLGNEIVSALKSDWRLDFLSAVTVMTDPCESVLELTGQRRRWINSSAACRLAVVASVLKGLVIRGGPRPRVGAVGIALSQSCMLAIEFTSPAQAFLMIMTLLPIAGRFARLVGRSSEFWLIVIFIVSVVVVGNGCIRIGWLKCGRKFAEAILYSVCAICVLAFYGAVLMLSPPISWYIELFPLGMGVIVSRGAQRTRKGRYVEGQVFALTGVWVNAYLTVRSIWRLSDVSWGTKGLIKPSQTSAPKSLQRVRDVSLATFIMVNVIIIVLIAGAWEPNARELPGFMYDLATIGWIAVAYAAIWPIIANLTTHSRARIAV